MKTCSLSEAQASLSSLADEALNGRPTSISHGGRLLILEAYDPPSPSEFDTLIDEGIASDHEPVTPATWANIRTRGRKLAKKLAKG